MSKQSNIKKQKKSILARVKITINRGVGSTSGELIDFLSDNMKMDENWMEIEPAGKNRWKIVNDSMSDRKGYWVYDATELSFSRWDEEVENLDGGGDHSDCFGLSEKLRWKNVTLTPKYISAPSVERIKEALEHVQICAWCPGDV